MNDLVACAVMLVEAPSLVETMTEVGVVNTGMCEVWHCMYEFEEAEW